MIKSYLNKGISTPVAILIILILAILVRGFIYWHYLEIRREKTELLNIEIPEKVDETADWKTYQSERMGFSIKCPSDFKVHLDIQPLYEPSRDLLVSTFFVKDEITDKELIMIQIESWTKLPEEIWGEGFTFKDFINDEIEYSKHRLDPKLQKEDFIIDDILATKVSYISHLQEVKVIYIQKGERMYQIVAQIDSESQNVYLPIFNQMLHTLRFIEPGITDWKNYENVATDFCKKEDGVVKYSSLLNFDQNTKKEIFVMCATSDWSFWTPGGQGVLNLYVLESEDGSYQIIWQKNTSDDFNLRAVREPKIVDIDRDGIDEIILAGSNWGGTCTYSIQFNFVYSPKYNEVFSIEERKGIKLSEDKVFCIEKERKYNSGCDSWDINSVCFSNNLKKSEYKIFKTYLENLLAE
jgi:hypothetical protein